MHALAPIDLLRAHPWERVLFTTYALSLSFFESVVLDELIRKGSRNTVVLADVEGVRNALSELGARRVGRDYEVEPVAVANGYVFHPKITLLVSDTETHVLVGSGNLTFGGWGGNLEVLDYLHAGFAADALDDMANFFEALSVSTRLTHEAQAHCMRAAADLRRAAALGTRSGRVRFVHSLRRSILKQVAELSNELGGALRLTVASPYWDRGLALEQLSALLGLHQVHVHAHPAGVVLGTAADNWPRTARVEVEAVTVGLLDEADPTESGRRLHAKLYEVVCRRGRLILSGSANATNAALGPNGNVEACVIRIEREASSGWTLQPSAPLPLGANLDAPESAHEVKAGVLRAVLNGDELTGRIIASRAAHGRADAQVLSPEGRRGLGSCLVKPNGKFSIHAPGLEFDAWRGSRLVLRLEIEPGTVAEGFISFAAFAEIVRRIGPVAPRFFSLLAGTEVPSDIAAVLSWACDNPGRLARAASADWGGSDTSKESPDTTVSISSLLHGARSEVPPAATDRGGSTGWKRFLEAVLTSLREPRGPLSSVADPHAAAELEEDEEGKPLGARDQDKAERATDTAVNRALENFDKLFLLLVSADTPDRNILTAFELAQYVCDRLRPNTEISRRYLRRLAAAFSETTLDPEAVPTAAAAIMVALASEENVEGAEVRARLRLLRIGYTFGEEAPAASHAERFRLLLAPDVEIDRLWPRVLQARAAGEQVRAYWDDLQSGCMAGHYPALRECKNEWPTLERALTDPAGRNKIRLVGRGVNYCPRHGRVLPISEAQRLRQHGVASARDCCGTILLCMEI